MNMYAWIFLGSYAAALIIAFVLMSFRIRDEVNMLISKGATQQDVDYFYRSIGRVTLLALVQATIITGTALGAIGSLIGWLVTK